MSHILNLCHPNHFSRWHPTIELRASKIAKPVHALICCKLRNSDAAISG
jgi:hypothetical protein